jgi:hypothetical protein
MLKKKKFTPIDRVKSNAIAKAGNYRVALHMLCIKMGWEKEYAWYVLRRNEEMCAHGGREEFIRKATRLLALNYDGIHSGANPALSPRLLPESNPLSQPIRYPKEWKNESL